MTRFDPLTVFWWHRVPAYGRRVSRGTHTALEDGHYLTGYSSAAGIMSTIAIAAGLIASLFRPFDLYFDFYTESALLVGGLLCLGFLGAHYGLLGWLGFVVGDLITAAAPSGVSQLSFRFASLVAYAALLVAIVGFPVGIRKMLEAFRVLDVAPPAIVVPIATTAMGVLAFYAVSVWINSQQLIARMFFFYQGFSSATDASTLPLQDNATTVARAVAVAAIVRTLLAAGATLSPRARSRVEAFEQHLVAQRDIKGWGDDVPQVVRSATAVLLVVLLLGGVVGGLANGLVMFAVLLFFQLIRSQVIPLSLGRIQGWVERIPALLRVVLLFVIAQQVTARVPIVSYGSLLYVTVAMLVIATILLPPSSEAADSAARGTTDVVDDTDIDWFPGDYRNGVAPDGSTL